MTETTPPRPGPIKTPKHPWVAKDPLFVPEASKAALRQALALEGLPLTDYDDLLWIMAQESEGVVDQRNPASSARGLYQLLRALYHFNPRGEASFGNAIEECQGGIRYVVDRYGSAANARRFWEAHHWY